MAQRRSSLNSWPFYLPDLLYRWTKMNERPTQFIAVGEDDPDDRLILQDAFRECAPDLRLEFFDNGPDLIDFLERGKALGPEGLPRLILVRLHLPKKSGFEIIAEIKADPALRRIPLLVLAGSCSEEEIKSCYELGANTVIAKPSNFDEFVEVMKKVCQYWFSVGLS
jgi:two-component system, response regulator